MYVPVKGGETAIAESLKALARNRRGDPSVPELSVTQIREQMRGAVDRVMTEGSLYDPDLAALALKQARGDLIEAVFLVRAARTTLPRFGAAEAIDTAAMDEEAAKKHKRVLRYWRTRLATAELRPAPDGEAVAFGTRVTYRLNKQEKTVAIVGDDEADPHEGRISFSAPLARAMMDAEMGEAVDFAGKESAIEIMVIGVVDEA